LTWYLRINTHVSTPGCSAKLVKAAEELEKRQPLLQEPERNRAWSQIALLGAVQRQDRFPENPLGAVQPASVEPMKDADLP